MENIIASGYRGEGFFGTGHQLGGERRLAPRDARESRLRAQEAPEKRARLHGWTGTGGGGRKLGGTAVDRTLTPSEMATMAAIRRADDAKTCGNRTVEEEVTLGVVEVQEDPLEPALIDLTKDEPQKATDPTWACLTCTFVNEVKAPSCAMCETVK